MDKNNKKNIKSIGKSQNQGQKTGTGVVNKKEGKMNTNLNKSVSEIKHKESLLGNNVLNNNNKSKGPKTGTVSKQKENLKSASNNLGQGNSKKIGKDKTANDPKKILDEKVNMSDKLNKNNNKAGGNEYSIFGQENSKQNNKNKTINDSKKILDKKVDMSNKLNRNVGIEHKPSLLDHGSKLDNKGKDSKTEVIKNQKINPNLEKNNDKEEKNEFSIFDQENLEQDDETKIINELKKIFDQYEKSQYEAKLLKISGKNDVSVNELIDCYASDVQGFGDCGPLSILESRSDNKNCRMKNWRFRIFLLSYIDKNLDQEWMAKVWDVLNAAKYSDYEKQQKPFLNQVVDNYLKLYNKDKSDTFYSNQKVNELREEILNAIKGISDEYASIINQNESYKSTQNYPSLPFSTELEEILNYFPLNIETTLNDSVSEHRRYIEKQELLNYKFVNSQNKEEVGQFSKGNEPLNDGDLKKLNYEKARTKKNINAKILFMALSYIEKKPIFCLMDSEYEKGLYVFDASRISDPKLKHKCIFRLDNNGMDNQIEYPLDLIYDFRKQLDIKDNPVFFFRSEPKYHFQYLEPNNQEKRTAFNNDMNRLFFDKYVSRLNHLELTKQKGLAIGEIRKSGQLHGEKKYEELEELRNQIIQKEKDLNTKIKEQTNLESKLNQTKKSLQEQKAEFQMLQKMAILNNLQVLANACLIAWTSYIAYAFACLFKPIFKVCQIYVDNFKFAKELNQKINGTLKSDVEQVDCFENSINDLMSYIDSKQNIERKLLEKLLPVYVMLAKYYPQHDTGKMLQKLQPFQGVQQVGIISNFDFYIGCLQNQPSDKIEQNSQNNIIKDKSNDSVNSTKVTSVSENKIVPIVEPLTNKTLDKNKSKQL